MLARIIVLIIVSGRIATGADAWRPVISSDVALPARSTVMPLLRVVCPDALRTQIDDGREVFGCGEAMNEIVPPPAERRYGPSQGMLWRADGIIFGHFLSPDSDDVAISGAGPSETHPYLWGGTLLLTKKTGEWQPVWYKMGVVTRHCHRVPLSTGRQILFCEEVDSGMGHALRFLYTVDFLKPVRAWDSAVFVADSYNSLLNGGVQEQSLDRVEFGQNAAKETTVRIVARHGLVKLRIEDDDKYERNGLPSPRVRTYRVELRLTGDHFAPTADTAAAAKLFSIH